MEEFSFFVVMADQNELSQHEDSQAGLKED